MIPGITGGLTNSGSMPITGGASTNGDQTQKVGGFGSNRFGTVNQGINPNYLIIGGLALAAMFLLSKRK